MYTFKLCRIARAEPKKLSLGNRPHLWPIISIFFCSFFCFFKRLLNFQGVKLDESFIIHTQIIFKMVRLEG